MPETELTRTNDSIESPELAVAEEELKYGDFRNTILHGNCCELLDGLPEKSIQTVVTSPPYWALRDYSLPESAWKSTGWSGCLGLEPTMEMWLSHIVEVFQSVRRVLRDDGTVWMNLGDSFCSKPQDGLKVKDLMGQPWRAALALQEDGWWLRADVLWHKPNPLPEATYGWRWARCRKQIGRDPNMGNDNFRNSGRYVDQETAQSNNLADGNVDTVIWEDCEGCEKCNNNNGLVLEKGSWRPTVAHEYIFLLAKSKEYFCDGEAAREMTGREVPWDEYMQADGHTVPGGDLKSGKNVGFGSKKASFTHPSGKNPRSVWSFPLQPFPGAHFATYPENLVRKCLTATASEKGACAECSSPWVREVMLTAETSGWRASCSCDAGEPVPCLVLDPFMGSGTTALVAKKMGHDFVGCELSEEYIKIADERLSVVMSQKRLF